MTIDCNDWDGEEASFWRLLRRQIEQDLSLSPGAIPLASQPQRDFQVVRDLVQRSCQEPRERLTIILDDSDVLFTKGPVALLEQLRTLRDYHRDQYAYLLFTKQLPLVLGRAIGFTETSPFYELFASRIYALRPYDEQDATQMLRYLDNRDGHSLGIPSQRVVLYLAGGHANLLRLMRDVYVAQPPAEDHVLETLATNADIRHACRRILSSLHPDEQEVLARLACGQPLISADIPALDLLQKRGLLLGARSTLFSPVFAQFLQSLNPALK